MNTVTSYGSGQLEKSPGPSTARPLWPQHAGAARSEGWLGAMPHRCLTALFAPARGRASVTPAHVGSRIAHLLLALVFVCLPLGMRTLSAPHAVQAQAGNLLVNGSFELGASPGGSFITLQRGSTAIAGWTVTRATIDYIGGWWRASDGARSLDLDGTPGFGGIAQTFATAPGRAYRVAFDLAGNPAGPPAVKALGVRAAGQQARFTFDVTGKRYDAMGWTRHSWTFTATATMTTLEFYSLDATGGSFGPALDNVSVTAS